MELLLRFLFNLITIAGVIAIVTKLDTVKKTFVISLAIFNLVIFCLSTIFKSQEMSLGSSIGLFALFTLIRYRSEPLKISELSYILICACFGILNAIYPGTLTFLQLIILDTSILIILTGLLRLMKSEPESYKIRYDRLELLKPEYRITLLNDLKEKLGISVDRIEVESINYPEHYANLKVFFKSTSFKGSPNPLIIESRNKIFLTKKQNEPLATEENKLSSQYLSVH